MDMRASCPHILSLLKFATRTDIIRTTISQLSRLSPVVDLAYVPSIEDGIAVTWTIEEHDGTVSNVDMVTIDIDRRWRRCVLPKYLTTGIGIALRIPKAYIMRDIR